jgi:hypothetical protein
MLFGNNAIQRHLCLKVKQDFILTSPGCIQGTFRGAEVGWPGTSWAGRSTSPALLRRLRTRKLFSVQCALRMCQLEAHLLHLNIGCACIN